MVSVYVVSATIPAPHPRTLSCRSMELERVMAKEGTQPTKGQGKMRAREAREGSNGTRQHEMKA